MTNNINIIENDIDKVRIFIENNFINSKEIKANIINFKKLFDFLNENNIKLNYYELRSLVECSYKLENTINTIKQKKALNKIFKDLDDEIKTIYIDLVNITNENNSKRSKESNYKEFNNYVKTLLNIPKLSVEEEQELLIRISNGDDEAKEKLIISFLPLVVGIAGKYKNAWNFEELVQFGIVGLIEAVNNYDIEKGIFYTYAAKYIEKSIIKRSQVNISFNIYAKLRLILKAILNTYFKENRVLSNEELSNIMNLRPTTIEKYEKIIDYIFFKNYYSFDKLNLDKELINYTEEDEIIEKEYNLKLRKLLLYSNLLTLRERQVIKLFYFYNIENQEDIGRMLGITRKRVQQLRQSAINKYKNYLTY